MQAISDERFSQFLESGPGTRATEPRFEDINIAVNSLNLHEENNETLEQYKDILTDPYKRHDHKHLMKLLQTNEAIANELASLKNNI